MATISIINVSFKGFVALGETIPEQFATMSKIVAAQESGDYSEILKLATVDKVKMEPGRRRIGDTPEEEAGTATQAGIADIINGADEEDAVTYDDDDHNEGTGHSANQYDEDEGAPIAKTPQAGTKRKAA